MRASLIQADKNNHIRIRN